MIDFSKKPLFLAPLAGYSDIALRGVVKRFGCDVTTSEMISANALAYNNDKTLHMLKKHDLEKPYIVQIAGSDKENVKKAVEILNKFDFIDGIDLNCGCPVPKAVKQNIGSSLLKDIDLLTKIVDTIKKYSNKKYTSVKIRLGFDEKIPEILAKNIENCGVDYIAIHGRTRNGGYKSKVDYEAILRAKNAVNIPVIANGDISSKNATDVLEQTRADGLMIGRASIGNPWIFYEIKTGKSIDKDTRRYIILCHFDEIMSHYGDKGVAIFRKHLHEYSKSMSDASVFRNEINHTNSASLMIKSIEDFF
ncbi:tRNA-dihydrouridine synthase B [Campylobacter blaseri]|uniref:tRNA-dihydrouridine synthase n=1 Tax=Campylobacter blaseri TaxID=2042961 RepID=A0A2P8QZB4_9BACT|nr:tRNA-dihydrouridine synthase [Campylobacter blaseri]PSM51582.1 tRNA dihydrouridine synthase DusB [Campylobacter blaseri]PSM53375.1 tRNA dihydrouridine synthase DusB [Campylobacter blaseri]QKF86670.1 tRNA-dihydrouridine synthase B [Campylobacter blaseri]